MISHKAIKEIIEYNADTGIFTICENRKVAGSLTTSGYVAIKIRKLRFLAHRLAFFYMKGVWPKHEIDHIDGNRSNNQWRNLRPATRSQNAKNRKRRKDAQFKMKGVSFYQRLGKYSSFIMTNGRQKHLGLFSTEIDAALAYDAAARRLHGEFAHLNFPD